MFGLVIEDDVVMLIIFGVLIVIGGDVGEDQFEVEVLIGNYGELVMVVDGIWIYSVDNSQVVIQDFGVGEMLSDMFIVINVDGVII